MILDPQAMPKRSIVRHKNSWTLKEHEVVVTYWPDTATIKQLIPYRTQKAIDSFAGKCNLRRSIHHWTTLQDSILRKRVKEGMRREDIGRELGLTVTQLANRMQYSGLSYGRRPPRPTGHKLMDSIRQRLFELNMTPGELDEACNSGRVFRKWSPARSISFKHILRALKVLDGELRIDWGSLGGDEKAAMVALSPRLDHRLAA